MISRETHQIKHGHAEIGKRTRQAQVDLALCAAGMGTGKNLALQDINSGGKDGIGAHDGHDRHGK